MEKTEKKTKSAVKAVAHKYISAVGRRKTAIARVRMAVGKGSVTINERPLAEYFGLESLRRKVVSPIKELKIEEKFDITVRATGGGINAQAEAIRHGIARVLIAMNPEYVKRLRVAGFLTRDPRMVERKKYGLKKARRAPQWQKR